MKGLSMEEEINNNRYLPPNFEAPWLVYRHGYSKHKKIQTFCTISSNNKSKSYIKSIPELRGKLIRACCYGWLVLEDEEEDIVSLWNPVTLQAVHLPPLSACDEEISFSTCTLTSPPESDNPNRNNCVVLLFGEGVIYSCRPGSRANCNYRWSAQRIELEGELVNIEEVITLNNVIYCFAATSADGGVSWTTRLVSMEVSHDDSNSLTLNSLRLELPPFLIGCPVSYLVESSGFIYSVCVSRDDDCRIIHVGVWELDLQAMSWVEVNCLDGRSFFLRNNYSSTWCWGSTNPKSESGGGVDGNCVYFLIPDDPKNLYSYRLHDHSLTLLLPCPNLVAPHSQPTWVMPPQHQRLLPEKRIEKLDITDQGTNIAKCQELLQRNDSQENLFSELPSHMIELLPKYMHLFDYWNFRASCKIFHSLAPAPQWRTNNSLPLFVFFKKDDELCVMDPCRDDSYSFILQLSRDFFSVEFSKNGWLLVLVGEKSLQYCNPFMRVRGEFPPSEAFAYFTSSGFSTYPTSPDCLTIGLVACFSDVIIYCLHYGEDRWHGYEFPRVELEFSNGSTTPIYHAGAFYFLDGFGYLGVFELVGGEASWRVYNKPNRLDGPFHSYHLVECDGELLSVFIGDKGRWVKVFRFNCVKTNWVKVKSLENHILFVGPSSSFSVVTRERGMGNRIYLGRLQGNDIIYYSLETRKYHVFGNSGSMEDFYGTTQPLRCCWV